MIEEEFNILSGQELINLRLKENRDLPLIGQKEFQPTNSWLEKKQIQCALAERKSLLEAQRVEKSNALSSAEWIAEAKKAKVTKKVGKLWENFGHHADDADWLFPEEALLLLETNSLELLFNEMPISIERGYVTLLNKETGCTLIEYRAYSHLTRLGFKLFRHLAEVSVTRYEKEIHLDQHVLNQKRTYGPNVNMDFDIDNRNNSCNVTVNTDGSVSNISQVISVENLRSTDEIEVGRDVVPVLRENDKSEDIIQIEPEESMNSSDVLSIISKAPTSRSDAPAVEDICIDDDDDDVVEIPCSKEVVVVNDLSSSSSDDDEHNENETNDSSDSDGVSQVSNSNWKRRTSVSDVIDVSESPPPRYAIRTNYVTVNEFLYEPVQNDGNELNGNEKDDDVIELSDDENAPKQSTIGKEIKRFYKEIEIINIDSEPEDHSTTNNVNSSCIKLSKKEILDLFPNLKNGVVNIIKVPSDNLLPPNIKPSRKEYSLLYNTSDLAFVAHNSNRNRNYNNPSNSYSNSNISNNNPICFVRNKQTHDRRREFQSSYNPSSYYYNQNRPRYSDNANQVWAAPPWQTTDPFHSTNPLQNQVTRIREMATGMMQFASSLLSLPFVQQALPNVPSLLDINQSFHQSVSRMPTLYQPSNQLYQNQGNGVTDQRQFFGPRVSNFSNNLTYGNPSFNQRNNMITYNSSIRQQFHSVPYNHYNRNVVPNLQRQHYNQDSSNASIVPNEQNVQRFSQQNIATDCNIRDNNYSTANQTDRNFRNNNYNAANLSGSVNRSFLESFNNQNNQPSNINQRNQELKGSENVRTNNVHLPATEDISVSSNQNDFGSNKVAHVPNNHNQGQSWNNNSNKQNDSGSSRGKRKSTKELHRPKRQKRYFIDTMPEYSVFTNDIDVSDSAVASSFATNNSSDYLSFNDNQASGNNLNGNHTDCSDRSIDVNWEDYIVTDDINRRVDSNGSSDFRNRGYHYSNRKNRWWYNRNRGYRRPHYNSPNKRPNFHNEFRSVHNESTSTSNELRNVLSGSRNLLDESIGSDVNDVIEIIEDLTGNSGMLSNLKRNTSVNFSKRRRPKKMRSKLLEQRKKLLDRVEKSKKSWRRNKKKPIEVIDIDVDETPANIKVENQSVVKAEKNVDTNLTNKDNNSVCKTLLMKREGLDDDASRNSIFSNSCISTNSTNSSCIIKSEPSVVKQETAAVKQETSSLAISTSISSVATSTVETVIVTTTETVINVKLENNCAIKTEKTKEPSKDSFVNNAENVTNESVNIKAEKASEVISTSLKVEKDIDRLQSEDQVENVDQCHNTVTVSGNVESSVRSAETTVNSKNDEDIFISENVEMTPVASNSSENSRANQNEKSVITAEEVISWAQLKQKSSTPVTSAVEETPMSAESEDDDEEQSEDEDEEQVRPIIKAKDCKSIGTVLSALQVIGTADLSHTTGGKIKISYDVYIPNVQLKKSSRGLPNYRLVIMSFRDDVPSPQEMAELSNRFQDGVPILIAIVSPDSLSFFMASTIRLPTDDGS